MTARRFVPLVGLLAGLLLACGGGRMHGQRAGFARLPADEPAAGSGGVSVRWTLDLAPNFAGSYVPVERAGVAVDTVREQIHVGSSFGELWTLDPMGKKLATYKVGVGIESPPVVDLATGRVWVAAVTGEVHALSGASGEVLWKTSAGGPVSAPLVLTDDALYLVTDDDSVVAIGRDKGEILWRYSHEVDGELSIAGHAGLLLSDHRLYTGFSDGVVVALDAGDGRELFRVDTAADVVASAESGTFVDVDTTPVRVGDSIYIASFAAGLYELDAKHGAVLSRESTLAGVTHLSEATQALVLSSASDGLVCFDLVNRTVRWTRSVDRMRGVPSRSVVDGGKVFVGATRGAFLVFAVSDGQELARVESAHGYLGAPVLAGRRGFILSNTARLVAFSY